MIFGSSKLIFLAFVICLQLNFWNGIANAFPVQTLGGSRRVNLLDGISNTFSIRNFTSIDALTFLRKFGWLTPNQRTNVSQPLPGFGGSLRDFQSFQGIPVTGELDNNTIEVMEAPRCGVMDRNVNGSINFKLLGSKWEFRNLTYTISKYPRNPRVLGGREQIDAEIRRAFGVWEQVVDFTFTKQDSGRADINIRFESGEHGHGEPFDGRGKVLAHARAPSSGMVHFDEAEEWTIGSPQGINFFQVAAHEQGHALGLAHSQVRSALMYPSYGGYQPNFQLDQDDIKGIQTLYGETNRPSNPPRRGGQPGTPPPRRNPGNNQPQTPRMTPTANRPSRPTPILPPWVTPREDRPSRPIPTGGTRSPSITPSLTPNDDDWTPPTGTRPRRIVPRPGNTGSSRPFLTNRRASLMMTSDDDNVGLHWSMVPRSLSPAMFPSHSRTRVSSQSSSSSLFPPVLNNLNSPQTHSRSLIASVPQKSFSFQSASPAALLSQSSS